MDTKFANGAKKYDTAADGRALGMAGGDGDSLSNLREGALWESRSMPPRLPAELTDRIIGHLHFDKLALTTCSLVCKDWLPASRYHFFQTNICLTRDNVHSFVELLNSPASTFFGYALHVHIFPGKTTRPLKRYNASCIFETISHHLFRLTIKSLRLSFLEWDVRDVRDEKIFSLLQPFQR